MGATPAVCEHLHYPLQSGSDRVLALMHRGYTAERYLERLAQARAAVADLAVSTDIIVGFPGETDDDFARTLEVAAAAEYDYAYTFLFSPREGTEAAAMTDLFTIPPSLPSASSACASSSSTALSQAPGASAASKKSSSRGRARRIPRCCRAAPGRTSSCTSHPPCRCAPVRTQRWRSPAPHRTTSSAASWN
jgi:hypothetical protein